MCWLTIHCHCSTVLFSYFLNKHTLFFAIGVTVGDDVESDGDPETEDSDTGEHPSDVNG